MKGINKKQFIETINELYESDTDLVLQYEIDRLMETYGSDYYYNKDNGTFEQ